MRISRGLGALRTDRLVRHTPGNSLAYAPSTSTGGVAKRGLQPDYQTIRLYIMRFDNCGERIKNIDE